MYTDVIRPTVPQAKNVSCGKNFANPTPVYITLAVFAECQGNLPISV